jgi:hypothetical protein
VIRRWLAARRERATHNDRDYECRYWWGDRGGYDLHREVCTVCRAAKAGVGV